MRTADQLATAAQRLNVKDLILGSLQATEPQAAGLQRQQTKAGLRADDRQIFNVITGSKQYSRGYQRKKGKAAPIDLYDTGAFSRAVFADARPEGVVLDSADTKTEKLLKNYGQEVFGLGTQALTAYQQTVAQALIEKVTEGLNATV